MCHSNGAHQTAREDDMGKEELGRRRGMEGVTMLYNLSCSGVSYVDQAGLKTTEVCFLLPPKHWE